MTAPRFLAPTGALEANRVRLGGSEGRHAAAVRRLRRGERVDLCDGSGVVVEGLVHAAGPDWLEVDVQHRTRVEPAQPRLVVAQALAKGNRSELAVELLTEVGVDEILPWGAERSVAQWRGERGARSLERWRSTAREAAKQARRAWLPVVPEPVTTAELVRRLHAAALGVVLHESARHPLVSVPVPVTGDVVLVIGPEGGLAEDEVTALTAAGGLAARLGPTVLRTSSAGAVAAGVVLAASGRWG